MNKTIKRRRKEIQNQIDVIDGKARSSKNILYEKLQDLHEECKRYGESGSTGESVAGYVIEEDDPKDGHLREEALNFYMVEDEEWVTIKTTRIIDMPRRKSCFRREEPDEDWAHHH